MPQDLAARWAAQLSGASPAQTQFQQELFRRTGIRRRGSVLLELNAEGNLAQSFYELAIPSPTTERRMERYCREAFELALRASTPALAESSIDSCEITHVITVSCTGCIAPGLDRAISEPLGLKPDIAASHIGFMGCAGVFNALAAAKPIVEAERNARVLLCAVEICTLHFRFENDLQQMIANSLFADGAAALTAQYAEHSNHDDQSWTLEALGSYTIPHSTEALGWKIGDHGFKMNLSAELPTLINKYLREWLEPWLARHHLRISDIPTWAIHPGGPKILDAAAESLGLPHECLWASAAVLADNGNMSSPTILFILQKLREARAPLPCVALGFGPGVVAHAAIFSLRAVRCCGPSNNMSTLTLFSLGRDVEERGCS